MTTRGSFGVAKVTIQCNSGERGDRWTQGALKPNGFWPTGQRTAAVSENGVPVASVLRFGVSRPFYCATVSDSTLLRAVALSSPDTFLEIIPLQDFYT
jgi:hypothetical protein